MKKILLSLAVVFTAGAATAQVDTLTEFFTGTPALVGSAGAGYVSGNNDYGDLGKFMRFDASNGLGNGTVNGVLLWIPVKDDNGGSFNVVARDFTGGAFGATLATETITLAAVDTSLAGYSIAEGTTPYNVAVTFSTPIAVTGASDIVIGIELPTTMGDTIALTHNTDGDFAAADQYTVEEWSDNSAQFFGDPTNWDLDVALAVFPIVDVVPAVGLEEASIEANVFPNPATTELNIEVKGEATAVSIITMDGKVVATQDIVGTSAKVNVAELTSGVYFYEVVAADGTVVRNTFMKK